jgi:hypothetical protein
MALPGENELLVASCPLAANALELSKNEALAKSNEPRKEYVLRKRKVILHQKAWQV